MNPEILFAFTIGMIVLAASPGPGVLASVSHAVAKGFRAALFFIGGLACGDIVFFMLALVGMSTISKLMGQFFFIIKLAGGLYLIWLGIRIILHRHDKADSPEQKPEHHKSFTAGFVVTMGNPKPILFYAGIVPTIIHIEQIRIYEVLAIIGIILLVSFVVIGIYCYLAIMSKSIFRKPEHTSKINVVAGIIMLAAGTYVLFKS